MFCLWANLKIFFKWVKPIYINLYDWNIVFQLHHLILLYLLYVYLMYYISFFMWSNSSDFLIYFHSFWYVDWCLDWFYYYVLFILCCYPFSSRYSNWICYRFSLPLIMYACGVFVQDSFLSLINFCFITLFFIYFFPVFEFHI